MPSNNEIITLQFGKYANFACTHFWNTICTEVQLEQNKILAQQQEKGYSGRDLSDAQYEFSRFFREGENDKKQSVFTPRCIIFDERREWSSLKSMGYMYNHESSDHTTGHDDDNVDDDEKHVLREQEYGMSKFTRSLLASDPSTAQYMQNEYHASSSSTSSLSFDFYENYWNQEQQKNKVHPSDRMDIDEEEEASNNKKQDVKSYTRDDILTELETQSRYWTDFLIPHLHPKSVFKMPNVALDESSQILSVQDIVNTYVEDSMDHIRFALEEADHFDGIQLFSNAGDWWSSVTSQFLPQMYDEFGKLSVVTSLVQPYISPEELSHTDINQFVSYSALGLIDTYSNCDYVIPMSGNQYKEWNSDLVQFGDNVNAYQWSSVLGTTWESLSRGMDNIGFRNWITKMSPRQGLRIGVLSTRMPLGIGVNENLHDFLMRSGSLNQSRSMALYPFDHAVTNSSDDLPFAQTVVYRGIDDHIDLYKSEQDKKIKLSMEEMFIQNVLNSSSVMSAQSRTDSRSKDRPQKTILSDCTTHKEMLDRYIDQTPSYMTSRCYIDRPSAIPYAYPRVFNTKVLNSQGYVDTNLEQETRKIDTVPMMVHAKTGGEIYGYVSQLQKYFTQSSKGGVNLPGYDLTKDEVSEKLEILHKITEEYRDD